MATTLTGPPTALDGPSAVPDAHVDLRLWKRRGPSPILEVLRPREHARLLLLSFALSLTALVVVRVGFDWVLWKAVALFLILMAGPTVVKWRGDVARFGVAGAVASILVTVQGLHTVEHVVQWAQRHVFHLSMRQSNGLLSPANSEWVHFIWNWLVTIAIVFLAVRGMRGVWGVLLMAWAFAHTLEHTYMLVRYIQVSAELRGLGLDTVTAQGLPGIFGAGGWLDLRVNNPTNPFFCPVPFITTSDRVDTHFAWNTGEILLLLPAVSTFLRDKVLGR